MHRTAVLVVDMLVDFFVAKDNLPAPLHISSLVEKNQQVCRFARANNIPLIFVNDSFQKTEVPIDRHFKLSTPHCVEGTEGAKILRELEHDEARDFVVGKKLYDGFSFLRRL